MLVCMLVGRRGWEKTCAERRENRGLITWRDSTAFATPGRKEVVAVEKPAAAEI